MNVSITPSTVKGEILAPSSKSYAHRLIILGAFLAKRCIIKNVDFCDDVLTTVSCVKSLGADIETDKNQIKICGFIKKESATLNANESGSTLRFLLPVCCALGVKTKFTGSQKLLLRPSEELIKTLNENGANIENFAVNGSICSGEFTVDGSISSQYVSGLLMALSLLDKESRLIVTGKKVSSNYIDITVDILKIFGVYVKEDESGYVVIPPKEKGEYELVCEGDYSGSAFILSLGAICGKTSVIGLNPLSKQGDREIVQILEKFGAKITRGNDRITVEKSALTGIEVDCENIPDLAQIIAVIGAYSKGKTTLKNIARLKYKESDRIKAILDMLKTSKTEYNFNGSDLEIFGSKPKGGSFISSNDHRTAMSASVLACGANGKSVIFGGECINKSYPNFFKDLVKLGGKADVNI